MGLGLMLVEKETGELGLLKKPIMKISSNVAAKLINGKLVQAEEQTAECTITYNYFKYYEEAENGGLEFLDGLTGAESKPILEEMISKIRNEYYKNGEWLPNIREKVLYLDENGIEREYDVLTMSSKEQKRYKKVIQPVLFSEGDTRNYWEATAANAIRALEQLVLFADELPDYIWSLSR